MGEKQGAAVRVIEDDRRVELLALRFVDGHDVDAFKVVSTRQELVFGNGGIQRPARISISSLRLPEFG